ncbi:MAG: tetratricopeptide repeat protein [Moorea sp. SIO1F2]|uniref:tetratricopeptide repeat protein n=1 Tax=Moorena sp. SIO1F2 TaxID=2607819 RepID=UPI0013BC8D1A|nr:tetratricopeptide repeat protein [Moorena sp. SIO1F2]NET85433.1 tetratricopeptide repeat protein [Moorena sp. SIO1F2]
MATLRLHPLRLKLSNWAIIALSAAILPLCFASVTLCQSNDNDNPNPLELTSPDPLLPSLSPDEPLNPSERSRLSQALDELNAEAQAEFKAGNQSKAFEIWYREIRLRRVLGDPVAEVQTLGRVGGVAWNENNKQSVQLITARLEEIQQENKAEDSINLPLLKALGKAYEQIRVPGQALTVYEQILADARNQEDMAAVEATLKTMGQLHMAWFDYPKAAETYEELLAQAQNQAQNQRDVPWPLGHATRMEPLRERINEQEQVAYLQELAYIYDQDQQPDQALPKKQQLVDIYLNQGNDTQIPALKIAIASDYNSLNQPEKASQTYQEAYSLAWSLQQFAHASEALQPLAQLYLTSKQPEFALQVYEVLLQVEQKSYNYYGLMNTYDKIGQVYLDMNNYPQALAAFQKGLDLAESLQHREAYFVNKIQLVNRQNL